MKYLTEEQVELPFLKMFGGEMSVPIEVTCVGKYFANTLAENALYILSASFPTIG